MSLSSVTPLWVDRKNRLLLLHSNHYNWCSIQPYRPSCDIFISLHTLLKSLLFIQYQALLDESRSYEPGSQYTEYLRHHLAPHQLDTMPDSRLDTNENYGFESIAGNGRGIFSEHSTMFCQLEHYVLEWLCF